MSFTNKQVMDAIAALNARLDAVAPAQSAPVTPAAEAPLYVSDKPRCAIHAAGTCTRKLSDPTGSHVACKGAQDPAHATLRRTHRHF